MNFKVSAERNVTVTPAFVWVNCVSAERNVTVAPAFVWVNCVTPGSAVVVRVAAVVGLVPKGTERVGVGDLTVPALAHVARVRHIVRPKIHVALLIGVGETF